MSRPKIAHITTVDISLYGLLLNQMRSLGDAGYEVVGISAAGERVREIEAAGVRHIAVPMTRNFTPLADLATLWRLYRVMRRERFTIVHTHTPKPGLLGQIAARMARVPIVINTVHGFYFHDHMRPAARRFYIAIEKIAARCSDSILSQNSEDIATAVRERICPPELISYLGNGIDVVRFDRARVDDAQVELRRREFGLPADAPVVGFVGRLVAAKGLVEFMEAARIVAQQIPKVRFLIVGHLDSDKPDALTPEIAHKHGVAHLCTFTGKRDDLPELYALMNVFLLPSHREGFPRVSMEASAMGIPSIVTDIRGCREAVRHGENGLLVPLGDSRALAAATIELLTNPQRAQMLGRAGRAMALERFDERLVFDKVKAEYGRLLHAKGVAMPQLRSVLDEG